MKRETKKDLLTNEPFIPKRINQQFSCSKNRIKYYNERANSERQQMAHLAKPLLRNFRILKSLLPEKGIKTIHKEFLLGKGFDFEAITHVDTYEDQPCIAIHQFILKSNENDKIIIINK